MTTYKGKFNPKNPSKYKGDVDNIIWRSTWELRVMKELDENPNVLEWSSEEVIIPYVSPEDGRYHRYFPDFLVKVRTRNGEIETQLLEVKPYHQTQEPKVQKRKTKKYITEVVTWGKNKEKWKAAREYCADRGWKFKLITEKELGIK
jgi:hypothetical protein